MVKKLLRPLLGSSFDAVLQYRLFQLHRHVLTHRRTVPLVVYQMGKVGSSSVIQALGATRRFPLLFHMHSLQPDRLRNEVRTYRKLFPQRRKLDRHLIHSLVLRRIRGCWPPAFRAWNLVTLVRDPVARNLSTFFQTLDLHHADSGLADRIRLGERGPRLLEDIQAAFVQRLEHRRAVNWFDEELLRFFGVDLLAAPFPHERGYRIARQGETRVLLLRLEDLNRCAASAFREFLGIEGLCLPAANVAKDKYYGALYRDVRSHLELPDSLLDELYGSAMMRALDTEEEIAAFRQRWGTRS